MKQTKRVAGYLLCTILLSTVLGGVYGRRVEATSGEETDIHKSVEAFTRVFDVVEQNYADHINVDAAIFGPGNSTLGEGAIPGMLRTLDPHSNFFDPHAFAQLKEEQEGKYYGVGMLIGPRRGKPGTMVELPLPDSPAFRAGLRPGDLIIRVNGKPTETLDSVQVTQLLKGPKGTVVHIAVAREGSAEPLQFVITRDEITRPSVDDAFPIRPGIAYVHIANFVSENTNDDLVRALDKLNEKTLKGMILDLRGNPGGLLEEAVEVSDHFLRKHQLIVYHYGRNSKEKRYYARHGDGGNRYPMVVLIDRQTASAAEIVAGALQDHDRALVMGEPSFGKGLVQSEYPLSEQTLLALTTSHYYTPSGRMIQRDYSKVSLYDYYFRPENAAIPRTQVRLTDGGREMYGGGGINPDIRVEEPKPALTQEKLLQHDAFFEFGESYLASHKTIAKDFQPDEQVLREFETLLEQKKLSISPAEFEENADFIKTQIRTQLVRVIYGDDQAAKITAENDYLVQKALAHLNQAEQLMANVKQFMAGKEGIE